MKINYNYIIKESIRRVLNETTEKVEIIDISGSSNYKFKNKKLKSNSHFIIHHTAGRGSAEGVVSVLNKRKLGVQWVIDRKGKIYQTLPLGGYGAHCGNSDEFVSKGAPPGINNSNSQGVEVIANNDADVLEIQAIATLKLVKYLGFKPSQLYGHGEIAPGHKQRTEGATIKKFIKDNWNKDPKQYEFETVSVNPSVELKPVSPAKSKEYLEYALAANKIKKPSGTGDIKVSELKTKTDDGEKVFGSIRKRDNMSFLFKFDNNKNLYYLSDLKSNITSLDKLKEKINSKEWKKL